MSANRTPRRGKRRGKGAKCSGEEPPRPKNLKKQKASDRRAHFYRVAKSRSSQAKSLDGFGQGDRDKSSSNVISSEEMRDILERRQRSTDDVLPQEVDEYMEEKELVAELEAAAKEYKEFQKSVAATNVPLWGDIDVNAKRDDVIRLLSGNLNGLAAWNHNNHKADRLRFLMTKLGLDVVGLQEVCVNWSALKPSHNIGTILRNGDEPIRSVASHNKLETKNAGRAQRGGTATVIRDLLAPFVKDSNVDHTKLGRWSWCVLEAEGGHRTRVVTAYSPVTNSATGLRTTVQQQWRYIRKKGLKTTPRQMFQDDLINLLRLWREKGDRLVLLMDANDHVVDGELAM